ncbi:MAG: hypothetical protein ABSF70_09155 [Terracidiphilus sp.]|jgi:hypothetical protein
MIFGLSLTTFTLLHVVLSLVGIVAGLIAIFGLISGKLLPGWTAIYLLTTILTSLTGFLFPFKGVTPGIVLGILSIFALLPAIIALYGRRLSGRWRGTFVITACLALYFNVFVLFAQLFAKVPELKAIAPTPASPAFGITQSIVTAVFAVLTFLAFRRFRGLQQARA